MASSQLVRVRLYLVLLAVLWMLVITVAGLFGAPGQGWGEFLRSTPGLLAALGTALPLLVGPLFVLLFPSFEWSKTLRKLLIWPVAGTSKRFAMVATGLAVSCGLLLGTILLSTTVWLRPCQVVILCEQSSTQACSRELQLLDGGKDAFVRLFLWQDTLVALTSIGQEKLWRFTPEFRPLARPALATTLCLPSLRIRATCDETRARIEVLNEGKAQSLISSFELDSLLEDTYANVAFQEVQDTALPGITLKPSASLKIPAAGTDKTLALKPGDSGIASVPVHFDISSGIFTYSNVTRVCVHAGLSEKICGDDLLIFQWSSRHGAKCEAVSSAGLRQRALAALNSGQQQPLDLRILVARFGEEGEQELIHAGYEKNDDLTVRLDVLTALGSSRGKVGLDFLTRIRDSEEAPHFRLAALESLAVREPKFDREAFLRKWAEHEQGDLASKALERIQNVEDAVRVCDVRFHLINSLQTCPAGEADAYVSCIGRAQRLNRTGVVSTLEQWRARCLPR
ncbi:hypothetical protein JY651_34625 [Pyxidicoccus parkwayensis]|uniref:HEAT repeat domain-containing protein n=1 Tax=Pyxidicoccus parkwayensis TaxID=2813578 RepID=A0ABX7NPJ5_9BACT|nr:hypothetical protein [Pyxidicoccus parkwaysis]QSQ20361.1 hypothetical protein JY651_34625 [Pyxidicoccus parkwaysis]